MHTYADILIFLTFATMNALVFSPLEFEGQQESLVQSLKLSTPVLCNLIVYYRDVFVSLPNLFLLQSFLAAVSLHRK